MPPSIVVDPGSVEDPVPPGGPQSTTEAISSTQNWPCGSNGTSVHQGYFRRDTSPPRDTSNRTPARPAHLRDSLMSPPEALPTGHAAPPEALPAGGPARRRPCPPEALPAGGPARRRPCPPEALPAGGPAPWPCRRPGRRPRSPAMSPAGEPAHRPCRPRRSPRSSPDACPPKPAAQRKRPGPQRCRRHVPSGQSMPLADRPPKPVPETDAYVRYFQYHNDVR